MNSRIIINAEYIYTYKYSIILCVGSTGKPSFIKLEPCSAKQSPAFFVVFFLCVHMLRSLCLEQNQIRTADCLSN